LPVSIACAVLAGSEWFLTEELDVSSVKLGGALRAGGGMHIQLADDGATQTMYVCS
jgi:hypothetical protein